MIPSKLKLDDWITQDLFGLEKESKQALLLPRLKELTDFHYHSSPQYRKIKDMVGDYWSDPDNLYSMPFLPVSLFKTHDILSVPKADIIKTLTSSGTSGANVSRIYLNKTTASNQTKILSRIMKDILGANRLPMLIVDTPNVIKNRNNFSARGAGILGFSMFGRDVTYALDENMNLAWEKIYNFLNRNEQKKVFIFGFTSIIWKHFIQEIKKTGKSLNLKNGVLLHGGGWKKLESQAVSQNEFSVKVREFTGIRNTINYYGMVEQTGSIFHQCGFGHLHAPIFSEIITRNLKTLEPLDIFETGVVQVISILPESYPGHSLLTEDLGTILGEDDCLCGRKGKYFQIHGRLKKAEIRGCSDTIT